MCFKPPFTLMQVSILNRNAYEMEKYQDFLPFHYNWLHYTLVITVLYPFYNIQCC